LAKIKTIYLCDNCGAEFPKWAGKCDTCGQWDTLKSFNVDTLNKPNKSVEKRSVVKLSDRKSISTSRLNSGDLEFDRVTGNGMMPGSVILLGGEPGVGKSTLLMQIACNITKSGSKVLYFSGEESIDQLQDRANRLGVGESHLQISNEQDVDHIRQHISESSIDLVIIDSIQTVYSGNLDGLPGSLTQVRDATSQFTQSAKRHGVILLLVGHITKDGYLAGPKMLEHMVDAVLYLEGDRRHQFRVLRAVKNRFGSTHELGVYEMCSEGMKVVTNPSEHFLNERSHHVSGTSIVAILEGTRPFLVEVQALVSNAAYGNPQRNVTGFDLRRLQMLLAVLERRAGFRLGTQDVFVNIAGGMKLTEPAADLGIAVAVASSLNDIVLDQNLVIIGEVGLGGEVRSIPQAQRRINEIKQLGFKTVVVPERNKKDIRVKDIELIFVSSVSETLSRLNIT
jgi:DNA repair protein RadA/Sms